MSDGRFLGIFYIQTFTYINENNYTYEMFPWIRALKDWHATFPESIDKKPLGKKGKLKNSLAIHHVYVCVCT